MLWIENSPIPSISSPWFPKILPLFLVLYLVTSVLFSGWAAPLPASDLWYSWWSFLYSRSLHSSLLSQGQPEPIEIVHPHKSSVLFSRELSQSDCFHLYRFKSQVWRISSHCHYPCSACSMQPCCCGFEPEVSLLSFLNPSLLALSMLLRIC